MGSSVAVVDSLFIGIPIVLGVLCLVFVFVMLYLVSFPVLQLSLDEKKRAGCFTLIVFLMSCDCYT